MFEEADKRRVLEATDLVRLIGESVAVKRKGREFACLCPFHDDRSPSMMISPQKQIYKCFPCGAGGDAISWMVNYHKMSFPEAVEFLAERAGIKLEKKRWQPPAGGGVSGGDGGPVVGREQLANANRAAADFFRLILNHAEHGKAAREIVEQRGISPAMADHFGIGAAPDKWDGLVQLIEKKGWDIEPFIAAGLVKKRENGPGYFDMFRHRLVFPITNTLGQVVGFGGRRLRDEDNPKYLNSPESPLFNKSATLYALPLAVQAIRQQDCAVVVEGYMDAVACHQAGVTNVVATLGTALTTQGARVLSRQCSRIVLLFDGDEAGQRAADRAIEVLFDTAVDVHIALMTSAAKLGFDAKDPDELVKQPGGVEGLRTIIKGAEDALAYRFDRLSKRAYGLTPLAKARLVEEELARLAELGLGRLRPVAQQSVIQRVATLAGVREDVVRQAVVKSRGRAKTREEDGPARQEPVIWRGRPAETALACLLAEPSMWPLANGEQQSVLAGYMFEHPFTQTVAQALLRLLKSGGTVTMAAITAALEDEGARQTAVSLASEIEADCTGSLERLGDVFRAAMTDCYAGWLLDQAGSDPVKVLEARRKIGLNRSAFPRRNS